MWLLLVLATVPVRTVIVPQDTRDAPLRITCPVHETTRIVFPEALRQLKGPASGSPLGFEVERTKPAGVIAVHPTSHPSQTTVEFRGPTLTLRLLLESAAAGETSEVHLALAAAAPSAPEPTAAPPASPPATAATPVPTPAAPLGSAVPAEPPKSEAPKADAPKPEEPKPVLFDLEGVLRAKPVSIGRQEGLPGQRPMVLVDALQGETWVWFRFTLAKGAEARIARVFWEQGEIAAYVQEPADGDLRVIVQVPRPAVNRSAHLSLEVASGPTYTFALGSRSLGRFLKELFR